MKPYSERLRLLHDTQRHSVYIIELYASSGHRLYLWNESQLTSIRLLLRQLKSLGIVSEIGRAREALDFRNRGVALLSTL